MDINVGERLYKGLKGIKTRLNLKFVFYAYKKIKYNIKKINKKYICSKNAVLNPSA